MISSAVSFKLLAAAAALGNVAIATAVLPAGQAVAFLAAISFAQLFQPFAGFGLVTRIVAIRDDEELLKVRHRHYFFLYAVIVAIASAFTSLGQGATWEIAVFAGLLALHAVESERVRAGYGNHSGIYVQNATVLLGSLSVLALGEFTVVPGVLIGLAYLGYLSKVPEAQSSRETTTKMTPTWADALKGLRAMSVTQFYSAIVVLAALILAPEEALIVTLVYRSGLFFNWQLFYWMRFGHKAALDIYTDENVATNKRLARLSFLAFAGASIGALLVNVVPPLRDLLERFDQVDLPYLAILIAAYGGVQFALSRTFPFEATVVYRTGTRPDRNYVAFWALGIASVAVISQIVPNAVALLIAVEVCRVGFRVLSYRQFTTLDLAPDTVPA